LSNDSQIDQILDDAEERLTIANLARLALGLPVDSVARLGLADARVLRVIPKTNIKIKDLLPRYSLLTLCIRAALLGASHPLVQHMAGRNHELDEQAALQKSLDGIQPA